MYIIPIAWLYVALMMGVAEATNTTGTVLGGIMTFALYGVGPVALVMYLMGAPARRKAIKARDKAEFEKQHGSASNAQRVNPPDAVSPGTADSPDLLGLDDVADLDPERRGADRHRR